jgi:hypothetical protein
MLTLAFEYGAVTLYGAIFQSLHLANVHACKSPITPPENRWFGLFRFRSPLLTESFSLSSPQLTEMFHFSWCRANVLSICSGDVPAGLPH